MLTAHLNALGGSIINDFNAAAFEKGVIYKINVRILVEVKAAAPIRLVTARLKPMSRQNGNILKTLIDYSDCVCAVKVLATVKQANHDYFG
jgi:hypothetical protein